MYEDVGWEEGNELGGGGIEVGGDGAGGLNVDPGSNHLSLTRLLDPARWVS